MPADRRAWRPFGDVPGRRGATVGRERYRSERAPQVLPVVHRRSVYRGGRGGSISRPFGGGSTPRTTVPVSYIVGSITSNTIATSPVR